jgi:hypothetical protein
MPDYPRYNAKTLTSISLDVTDQASGRDVLRELFPEREPIWLSFVLVPNDEEIDVLLNQTDKHGTYVGKIGNRNRDKLIEVMDSQPCSMRGLIEWSSNTPKVKFIPPYSTR